MLLAGTRTHEFFRKLHILGRETLKRFLSRGQHRSTMLAFGLLGLHARSQFLGQIPEGIAVV
jgi:hypothetical protein